MFGIHKGFFLFLSKVHDFFNNSIIIVANPYLIFTMFQIILNCPVFYIMQKNKLKHKAVRYFFQDQVLQMKH